MSLFSIHRSLIIATMSSLILFTVACTKQAGSETASQEGAAAEAPADPNAASPGTEQVEGVASPGAAQLAGGAAQGAAQQRPAAGTSRPAGTASARPPGSGVASPSGWGDQPSGSANATPAAPAAPPAPVMRSYTLPAGATLRVQTTSTLSSKTASSGDTFSASLVEPLVVDGRTIAAKGANVNGRIVNSDPGGRVKGKASIDVAITGVELVNGSMANVSSSSFGEIAKASTKKDAAKVAIGTGIGAAIGAIAGGGKGAAIGAGVGAGAGTGTVLATRGEDAVIPAESILNFTTTSPISITLQQ